MNRPQDPESGWAKFPARIATQSVAGGHLGLNPGVANVQSPGRGEARPYQTHGQNPVGPH